MLCIQNVTKGARNKILINVQKLQERAAVLRQLEKVRVSLLFVSAGYSLVRHHHRKHLTFHFIGLTALLWLIHKIQRQSKIYTRALRPLDARKKFIPVTTV